MPTPADKSASAAYERTNVQTLVCEEEDLSRQIKVLRERDRNCRLCTAMAQRCETQLQKCADSSQVTSLQNQSALPTAHHCWNCWTRQWQRMKPQICAAPQHPEPTRTCAWYGCASARDEASARAPEGAALVVDAIRLGAEQKVEIDQRKRRRGRSSSRRGSRESGLLARTLALPAALDNGLDQSVCERTVSARPAHACCRST